MAINYGLLQLLAVGITVILALTVQSKVGWASVFISLGLSHYFLAIYYARHRTMRLVNQRHSWLPAMLLLAIGATLYKADFPLIWYFLAHHVFNEVYLRQNISPLGPREETAPIRNVSLVFHTLAYLVLLDGSHYELGELAVPAMVLLGSVAATYFWMIAKLRNSVALPVIVNNVMLELIALSLIPLALSQGITFQQLVCYHFVFWALMPLLRLKQAGVQWFLGYSVLAIGSTALFLALSPMRFIAAPISFSMGEYYSQFILWSYVHITLAFATSSAFPLWIRRWFEERQPSAA